MTQTLPVSYTYDAQGRMKTLTTWQNYAAAAGAATTTWAYEPETGWLRTKTYPGGAAGPAYDYTPGGRLKTRTWARNQAGSAVTTTYHYDFNTPPVDFVAGDLVGITYSDGTPEVKFTPDRRGRPASVSLLRPGTVTTTETTTHAYNDANQLLSETYANGVLGGFSVVHEYDTFLRPKDLEVRQGTTPLSHQDYGFDPVTGRFKSVTQGAHAATYSYVANSDLIAQIDWKQSGAVKLTAVRTNDALNRLQTISTTTPGGAQMSYSYRYNDANQRDQVTLADGTHWAYGYDGLGQVNQGKKYWTNGTSMPVPGQQFEYTHDDIGNRTATKVGGNSTGGGLRDAAYTANLLNQYASRTVPGAVDVLGIANAASTVTVNGQSTYRRNEYFEAVVTVDNSGGSVWAPVSVSATRQGQTVQVPATPPGHVVVPPATQNFQAPTPPDADGNLKQDGVWTYTWDGENRLIAMDCLVTGPAAQHLVFEYDWQGRRIRKVVKNAANSVISDQRYLYDGWNLVAVFNAQSSLQQSFVWGLDLSQSFQGAGGVGGLLMVNDVANGIHYVISDGNGNVTAMISSSDGSTTARYEYGPFGEPLRLTGTLAKANPFRFSTKYADDETDLVYYGYRYYSPSLGRFINRDPIGEDGGINIYAFCNNDPGNYFDDLGAGPHSQFYQDPETEQFGFADPYDVNYLGTYRAVVCGDTVPGSTIGEGAPFELARLDALNGNSLEMRMGSEYAGYIGNALRGLPTGLAMGGTVAQLAGGLMLVIAPDPSCASKGIGAALTLDALDAFQSGARSSETYFEKGMGGLGLGESGKQKACCLKSACLTIIAYKIPTARARTYREVGGHHVHAKKAFAGHANYDPLEAFAASPDLLAEYGVRHADISPIQQRLFMAFDKSTLPNNLTQQSRIAYNSLVESGIPPEVAKQWVIQSQRDLIQKGVFAPTGIPWGKR